MARPLLTPDRIAARKELGARIKTARRLAGLNISELATAAGVTASLVSRLESGIRPMRNDILTAISGATGVSAGLLLATDGRRVVQDLDDGITYQPGTCPARSQLAAIAAATIYLICDIQVTAATRTHLGPHHDPRFGKFWWNEDEWAQALAAAGITMAAAGQPADLTAVVRMLGLGQTSRSTMRPTLRQFEPDPAPGASGVIRVPEQDTSGDARDKLP